MAAKAVDLSDRDDLRWKKKTKQFPITHKPEQINYTLTKGSESVSIPFFLKLQEVFSQLNFCFLSGWWDSQFLELWQDVLKSTDSGCNSVQVETAVWAAKSSLRKPLGAAPVNHLTPATLHSLQPKRAMPFNTHQCPISCIC